MAKRIPTCHPKKPHCSRGLCRSCYVKYRRRAIKAGLDVRQEMDAISTRKFTRERVFDVGPRRGDTYAAKQARPPEFVTITLAMRHSFNGKFYGPGTVKVPYNKANIFLRAEQEAGEKEYSLQQQQAFIINMAGGAPSKRQVPWAQFDHYLSQG